MDLKKIFQLSLSFLVIKNLNAEYNLLVIWLVFFISGRKIAQNHRYPVIDVDCNECTHTRIFFLTQLLLSHVNLWMCFAFVSFSYHSLRYIDLLIKQNSRFKKNYSYLRDLKLIKYSKNWNKFRNARVLRLEIIL